MYDTRPQFRSLRRDAAGNAGEIVELIRDTSGQNSVGLVGDIAQINGFDIKMLMFAVHDVLLAQAAPLRHLEESQSGGIYPNIYGTKMAPYIIARIKTFYRRRKPAALRAAISRPGQDYGCRRDLFSRKTASAGNSSPSFGCCMRPANHLRTIFTKILRAQIR